MKIGVSALLFNIDDVLEVCKKSRTITHIEIGIDNIEDCEELYKYKDIISKLGLSVGIHLPMELNTCDNIKYIRHRWVKFIVEVHSKLLGFDIKYFNIHLGYVITDRLTMNRYKYLKNSIDFLNQIYLDGDITISIENTYSKGGDISNVGNKVSDFEYIFKNIDNSKVCFCYDTGHYLISKDDYISKLKKRINIVHLSDNNGFEDSHLGVGMGILPESHIYDVLNLGPEYLVLEVGYEYIEDSINKLNFIKEEV